MLEKVGGGTEDHPSSSRRDSGRTPLPTILRGNVDPPPYGTNTDVAATTPLWVAPSTASLSMPESSLVERLKERKFVQWALAYLAGAFVVFQLLDALAEPLGLTPTVQRIILVVVAFGFLISLVIAWYHGEKGQQRVSGPELLMVTGLLAGAAVGIRMVWHGSGDSESEGPIYFQAEERSVAVLPLDDLSPADEHGFFAEAMVEEITSALTEVPELTVKSRNSAAKFVGSGMTVAEFARTLGVAHVIQGSVQRSDDRIRVSVQLIDARTDEHVWAETYERRLIDLFDLQVEVARQVADRLAASFTERERERILSTATNDPVAYDYYLRVKADPLEPDEEIHLLTEAVERDPTFWPAWERLAFSYLDKESRGDGSHWADSSRAALQKAIDVADSPPTELRLQAHRALIFGGEEDEEEAFARLRVAAEQRPSDLALATSLGDLYRVRGRLPEAVYWRRQAARLDPLEVGRWRALFQLYLWLRLYDEAEGTLRRALQLEPQNVDVWQQLTWHWMVQGRFDQALTAADSALALNPQGQFLERALVHWWAGDFGAAVQAFSEATSGRSGDSPEWQWIPMAHAHFAIGDSAQGDRLVERLRTLLQSRVIEDYEPEWRVFPRLQLAAIEGDMDQAAALFREYVDRGGRDPTWFRQSPLFSELREEPSFRRELMELERTVTEMRRRVIREFL